MLHEPFLHSHVSDLAKHRLSWTDNRISVALVEALRLLAGVQNDIGCAEFASGALETGQHLAAEAAAVAIRLDGHIPDLSLRCRHEVNASHGDRVAICAPEAQMAAVVLAIVALATDRLLPRRAEHAPSQIKVAVPLVSSTGRPQFQRFGACDFLVDTIFHDIRQYMSYKVDASTLMTLFLSPPSDPVLIDSSKKLPNTLRGRLVSFSS